MNVIALVGPTAVGKTALSIAIAEALGGEIVSADSRQVYRGLDIGTGKVSANEAKGIPHHLIDVADPNYTFTAADYVQLGRTSIAEISERGHVPIVVGGTGFYVDSLLGRMTLAEVPPNPALRSELEGWNLKKLQEELKKNDPERFTTIDINNPRRLLRAIEIASSPVSENSMIYHTVQYEVCWIGVSLSITELNERIHVRLFDRMREGMVDEARRLYEEGVSYERMEELGLEYRYMARHLQGRLTEADMLTELEKEIVAYAKRQITWFKKNKDITWFRPEEQEKIIEFVLHSLGEGP